jgi:trk system potassium uptake protein
MNQRSVLYVLGALLIFEGISMLFPLAFSIYYADGTALAFVYSILACVSVGGILFFFNRNFKDLRIREGFAIVGFGWTIMALFGALPHIFSGAIPSLTDAFFETMSGFSTTGASILTDIESLPKGILFWRSQTHWIGGMGIIVMSLAILPLLGVGGMQLFKAEVPGPIPDKLQPRIKETAKLLWIVYVIVTAVETIFLLFGGMDLFDSLCHTFGTVATGGFSTKNASIAHYNSVYIETVIVFFMFVAGTNFSLHYKLLRGNFKIYKIDREFLFYLKITVLMTVLTTVVVYFSRYSDFFHALRAAVFQVVSITTTTGYATDDYELWSTSGQLIMLMLMFIGGCAGSTGGSIKIIRIMLVLKHSINEIKKLLHPNAYLPVRMGGRVVQPEVITNVLGFFLLYMVIFASGSVAMAALGLDALTAISSVAATLGNIGPGLGSIGPTENYAHIPLMGKWLLSFFMLMGRLEIYTILILFVPEFWKK